MARIDLATILFPTVLLGALAFIGLVIGDYFLAALESALFLLLIWRLRSTLRIYRRRVRPAETTIRAYPKGYTGDEDVLEPGNPVYDVMMQALRSGKAVVGEQLLDDDGHIVISTTRELDVPPLVLTTEQIEMLRDHIVFVEQSIQDEDDSAT